jgi:hypothetical protein
MNAVYAVALPLLTLAAKGPEAKDVKAGWLAFGIFLLLVAATAALCFNFVKQLRKAQAAKDAGAYGDAPVPPADATTDAEQD